MNPSDGTVSLHSLRLLTESIYEGRSLTPLLAGLMDRAAHLPGVDTVRILLADCENGLLVAQPGTFPGAAHERPIPIGVGFAGRIASTRQPLLVDDLADFPVYGQGLREAGVRSAIGVPLLAGKKLVGVMHIGSFQPRTFHPELIPQFAELAERVALTIDAIDAQEALAESEQRFRTLFEAAPVGVCLTDLRPDSLGRVLMANDALAELTGYTTAQLTTMNVLDLLAADHRPDADGAIQAMVGGVSDRYTVERKLIRQDGSTVWILGHVAAVRTDDLPSFAVSYMQDVSARKEAESELARRAFTDALTGLANRHLVMDHLALALRQETRTERPVGVLYLDLDHFKDINDAHGHDAGDRVLRETAFRLSKVMRAADTPGRLGGDEFFVVCPQLSSDDELSFIADRLLSAMSAPVHLPDATTIQVAVSIGITTGDRSSTPEELVRRADTAMYEAKRQGRRCWRRYTEALDRSARERLAVESLLAEGLRRDLFVMHYQEIRDLRSDSAVGVEALVRIQHPERGLLHPEAFVDQLEQSDLADGIETAIIARACSEWSEPSSPPPLGLSINVSGRLAASGHLSDTVFAAAGRFPLNMLTIEMTERVMVHAGAAVMADIQRLADAGVRIAIDDFGTGYASLTYLQRFPVSVVKIDRSFVAGLGQSQRDDAIVRAVVTLGSSLDMTVIAEGVETEAQVAALQAAGCPHAQGYLFGRPLPKHSLQRLGFPAV